MNITLQAAGASSSLTVVTAVGIFLVLTLLLVAVLLVAKRYLVHSGKVNISINDDRNVEAASGKSLLSTLADENIFLPSACGGKGSCGQCKVRVPEGGGDILPTEAVHFTRKQVKDHWRLGCQVKVKEDMKIDVPASVLDIREWECTVVSNRNVATFIKEFIVALPPGEHMDFIPGSYAQIKIPPFEMSYDRDIDKSL
ncbi:MAG: 2Fe-2S iron-sulfur cluster binding domain-containing protein, partial [Paramuribaculum sp.]|nr:2Fe-2S iron-sulfur cluster binding domain-containing protein [Paramuribaculum sp.]